MIIELSTGEKVKLTKPQVAMMIKVLNDYENDRLATPFIYEWDCSRPRRETVTAEALVTKGLLKKSKMQPTQPTRTSETGRLFTQTYYCLTDEGFWSGDEIRANLRLAEAKRVAALVANVRAEMAAGR